MFTQGLLGIFDTNVCSLNFWIEICKTIQNFLSDIQSINPGLFVNYIRLFVTESQS
jgi:hypothetical protein